MFRGLFLGPCSGSGTCFPFLALFLFLFLFRARLLSPFLSRFWVLSRSGALRRTCPGPALCTSSSATVPVNEPSATSASS
ncbi:hypothetical protein, partial [Streptomyces sp. NPDC048845]|uniref:hypothetical protein n=1 Tax=Streptomyces sp. NPDC048845 TaxID=3155390 RepID=UPI00343EE0A4